MVVKIQELGAPKIKKIKNLYKIMSFFMSQKNIYKTILPFKKITVIGGGEW